MTADEAKRAAEELQLLRSARAPWVRFHGKSLHPFLREGDRVIVEPVAWQAIRAGDLITYRLADKYPTRRVVRRRGDRLSLWCEGWPWARYYASREDVLGRAVARERDGSHLRRDSLAWRAATAAALVKYNWWRFLYWRDRLVRALRTRVARLGPRRKQARASAEPATGHRGSRVTQEKAAPGAG